RAVDTPILPRRVDSRRNGRRAVLRGARGGPVAANANGGHELRARHPRRSLRLQNPGGGNLDVPTVGQRLRDIVLELRVVHDLPPAEVRQGVGGGKVVSSRRGWTERRWSV